MTALKGSPATKALAVRVYAHCKAFGWNVRMKDVADAIGVPFPTMKGCMRQQGWSDRFKCMSGRENLGAYKDAPARIYLHGGKMFLGINLDTRDD